MITSQTVPVSMKNIQDFVKICLDLFNFITAEIMLPSIKTIIKPSSYVCYENHPYTSTPYYSEPSPNHIYGSLIEPPNNTDETSNYANSILNLDDTFSTETEFNDLMSYDDTDKIGNILNTSNESNTSESISNFSSSQNGVEKEEKKVYPCRLCDKKYSTMTNIYRHVRAQHSCFLCSLCMKMFNEEFELKEHIHKCPKSDVKKPQCVVCMQYFSNSWSLTRHIKIHVSAGEW